MSTDNTVKMMLGMKASIADNGTPLRKPSNDTCVEEAVARLVVVRLELAQVNSKV